ncbi:DUF1566 domain-containing protein [Mariniflexile aquimaris]|uniref:DUF1566 domain-containing protein n=1 Tax=Mariniflexile aquimaris TaxID=881009 RepID=A0ABW3BWL4_9FLAO
MKNKRFKSICLFFAVPLYMTCPVFAQIPNEDFQIQNTAAIGKYKIVATNQDKCFDNYKEIPFPKKGDSFYGQDAQNNGNKPSYIDNGDGSITDNVTGLIWQKSYEVMSYADAVEKVKAFNLANKTDWRIPSIKEAYSLIQFNGVDVSSKEMNALPKKAKPFIDTTYFDFKYGSNGNRVIDVQLLSSTIYQGTTMGGNKTVFGVNLADGRIKGYPISGPKMNRDPNSRAHQSNEQRAGGPGGEKLFTVRFVRGNTDYGLNNFKDNSNKTISDLATGLMWAKEDSNKGMNWEEALAFAQEKNQENYLGFNDWRLPNTKELQSIVDYSRSPQSTNSAAINTLFQTSAILDEGGRTNFPFFWTSTTHESQYNGNTADYVCFGEGLGFMKAPRQNEVSLVDVHGAGAQRSDPKTGDASDYPQGRGPQGDVIRINNYVRLVRSMNEIKI